MVTPMSSSLLYTSMTTSSRWQMVAVLMVTVLVGYFDRINISLALPLIAQEFHWNDEQTQYYGSLLMSLFYIAYGLANIFLSPLGARLGPRRSLLLIIVLWSIFTALGAAFSQLLIVFMASRILLGLAEGIHFPMMSLLTQRWFPSHERSRANGIWIAGLFLAILSGPIILVPLMHQFGWRVGFHLLALAGLLISLPLVWRLVFDSPTQHPRISAAERNYLVETNRDNHQADDVRSFRLPLSLLKQPTFLLMMSIGILNNMISLGISSWLPTYFASKSNVDYSQLTYIASLPYVFSLLGLACWSWLGDKTNRRGRNACIGYGVSALCVISAFQIHNVWLAVSLFSLGVFFIAAYNACEFAMLQHLLPEQITAQGTGLYNGLSTMIGGGLGTAMMAGFMSNGDADINSWPLLLLFGAAALVIGVLGKLTRY